MGKKKKPTNATARSNALDGDWKSQLRGIKKEIISDLPKKEKDAYYKEQRNKKVNAIKLKGLLPSVYQFLAGYAYNSGIFINNFFRGRDFKTYVEDKFYDFDFDVKGVTLPNIFNDGVFSMKMVSYLHELEKNKIAYYQIDVDLIRHLKAFSDALEYSPRIEYPTVLYRGCSTLERNGVNGIVSVTPDKAIAKQFSRGTLLIINVPEGTKCLNVRNIRPTAKQRRNDLEKEILLPPCSYEILSQKEVPKKGEPNNIHTTTQIIEINVKPLDLLTEFLKMMENPPQEYVEHVLPFQKRGDFEEAKMLLQDYISGKY